MGAPFQLSLQHHAEVQPRIFDVHAGLLQHVGRHVAEWFLCERVGGNEQHDFLAVVTGGLEVSSDLRHVARSAEHIQADIARW